MKAVFLTAIFSFIICFVLTYLTIFISKRKRLFLIPASERWNKKPTPGFGGIAIFVSFIISILIFDENIAKITPILIGGSIIFAVGLLDDIFDIKPYTRLLIEIAVACFMVMSGVHLIFQDNPIIFLPLTILWIVGITNAFNLLDNMDGLSPGIGAIASFFLFMISVKLGLLELIIPSLVLCCILLAFLIFNFNPAKIFLGDCGSLFIGFMLATLSIKGTWHQASNLFLILLTPILILGIPIFDTFFVTLQRKLHGLPITRGGKDHSSHRLVLMGWSEKKAAFFLYIVASILGFTALIGLDQNYYIKSVGFAIALIVVTMLGVFLAQAKVYGKDKAKKTEHERSKTVARVLYKRRMLDVLIDSVLIIVAYVSAYLIKYDGEISDFNLILINQSLPIILIVKLASLYLVGLYKGVWRYIDFEDSLKIIKGALLGSAASIIILLGFTRFEGYSRALFFIDIIVFIFLLLGARIILRIMRESFYAYSKLGKRVLIVGAGESGKLVLTEIRKNRDLNINPVGIIDDDESKHGKRLLGVTVLGGREKIEPVVSERSVEKVLIAIPSATDEQREDIVSICKGADVDYKVMKSFQELL